MPDRDKFLQPVKLAVAQRAAYMCSRPECRVLTIGPHSEPDKSLSSGIAAHISGAAPGGPRYDPGQTRYERRGIENAVWLCHSCSDLIDKDEGTFPKEVLLRWKDEHEQFVRDGGGFAALPEISIRTIRGLTFPPPTGRPQTISGDDVARYREHVLRVCAVGQSTLRHFRSRIQFPERIVYWRVTDKPAGSELTCEPERMQMTVMASGAGSRIEFPGSRPPRVLNVALDTLPPRHDVTIHFVSAPNPENDPFIRRERDDDELVHHILGEFQFELHGQLIPRKFLIPLDFDTVTRQISSAPCEDDAGTRRVVLASEGW